jgi:hypothetical protein
MTQVKQYRGNLLSKTGDKKAENGSDTYRKYLLKKNYIVKQKSLLFFEKLIHKKNDNKDITD